MLPNQPESCHYTSKYIDINPNNAVVSKGTHMTFKILSKYLTVKSLKCTNKTPAIVIVNKSYTASTHATFS